MGTVGDVCAVFAGATPSVMLGTGAQLHVHGEMQTECRCAFGCRVMTWRPSGLSKVPLPFASLPWRAPDSYQALTTCAGGVPIAWRARWSAGPGLHPLADIPPKGPLFQRLLTALPPCWVCPPFANDNAWCAALSWPSADFGRRLFCLWLLVASDMNRCCPPAPMHAGHSTRPGSSHPPPPAWCPHLRRRSGAADPLV